MEKFEDVRRLRDEYDSALDAAEYRRSEYHAAVRRLYLSGLPLQEIADQLGISRQRVHQIVGEIGPAPKRRRRGRAIGGTLLAVGVLGALALAATWKILAHEASFPRASSEVPGLAVVASESCDRAPCPAGLRYEVLYEIADGRIVGSVGFRPQQVRGYPPTAIQPGRGQAVLEVTGRSEVPSLMSGNLGAFYVDVPTGEIEKRRDYRVAAVVSVAAATITGLIILALYWRVGRARDRIPPNVIPAM